MLVTLAGCGRAENSLLLMEELPDVASITIEGNTHFSERTLKGLMTLRSESWWNPFKDTRYRAGQLKTDINAILTFYMRHGYLRAAMVDQQVRRAGNKVHITLRVSEGEPITTDRVTLLGTHVLDPGDLQQKLSVKADRPLDPFALQDDRRRILRRLAERGYWEASVDADVQFFGNRALVFYRITEGDPVEVRSVAVSGLKTVSRNIADKEISVKQGKLLRLDDVTKSRVRLVQSGLFYDAQWDTTALDTTTDRVSVGFQVRERRLRWFETGIGVSSQELVRLTGEWGTRNFLGSGMRFTATSRTDLDFTKRLSTLLDQHRTDLILNRSHLLGTNWEGQPGVFYLYDREKIEDVGEYEQNIVGVQLSTRRRFGDLRNQIVFGLENRWVNNNAPPLVRENDPQLYRERYTTRLLSGRVERDTRNDFFNPSGGSYQNVRAEIAGGALGGNNGFFKTTLGNVRFRGLPLDNWVLATRIQAGYIVPSSKDSTVAGRPVASQVELIPSEDRYLLGGANTVRGYAQDALDGRPRTDATTTAAEGGLVSLMANVELRIPLFWRLGVVGFLDAGNVWQDRHDITVRRLVPHGNRAEADFKDLRYAYGLGLRLMTPVGPLRVDYARKWNFPLEESEGRDRWHVAIGQAF